MKQRGKHTYTEIYSQPDRWQKAIAVIQHETNTVMNLWQTGNFERILLTGCGSTYYLAQIGASLIQQQVTIPAQAITASEFMLFPETTLQSPLRTLFITVSRSGTTRETVEAARRFKEHGTGETLSITCHSESILAQESDYVLAIDEAREISRVQTRSFSSMAIVLEAFALLIGGHDAVQELQTLPATLQRLLDEYSDLARSLGENQAFTQFVFLGSGILYGLACEAMLKTAEMSLMPCTAFHTLEYLHGPKYTVNDRTLVVGLLTPGILDEEIKAIQDAKNRGATLLTILEEDQVSTLSDLEHLIKLQSGRSLPASMILYLPIIQLIGYWQAMARGHNPDTPGQK